MFLLFAALLLLSAWTNVAEGGIGRSHVKVENGQCIFDGLRLNNSEAVNREHPCMKVICDTDQGVVYTGICVPYANPDNCPLRKEGGVYPNCCLQPDCSSLQEASP